MNKIVNAKLQFYGQELDLKIMTEKHNGKLVVQAYSFDEDYDMWEPFATLSVNVLEDSDKQTKYVAKTYSENEGIHEQLKEQGALQYTGKYMNIGGFVGLVPVVVIDWEVA